MVQIILASKPNFKTKQGPTQETKMIIKSFTAITWNRRESSLACNMLANLDCP